MQKLPPGLLLVLLPGLDGTGKLFGDFVRALGADVESLTVAYPVDRALGYAELETLVRTALPSNRVYVVLGESFSGPIAIRLGADPPAGLAGIILCVTFAKNPYPLLRWARPLVSRLPVKSLPRWLRAPLSWGSKSGRRAPAQAERATAAVDAGVLRHRIAALLTVDESAALARIVVPTLVLQASADRVIPAAATLHMKRALPGGEAVTVDGPHLLLQTQPTKCAAIVVRFMRRLQSVP